MTFVIIEQPKFTVNNNALYGFVWHLVKAKNLDNFKIFVTFRNQYIKPKLPGAEAKPGS